MSEDNPKESPNEADVAAEDAMEAATEGRPMEEARIARPRIDAFVRQKARIDGNLYRVNCGRVKFEASAPYQLAEQIEQAVAQGKINPAKIPE